ncbi:hypothetical protein HE1_00894 [Holospora elegans E1]|uniref:Uncharacterized protein n=1 Tax=Holospora elegans E1 TaxID=1427503 RepID=A0A023DYK2_9PROT|nr:hypothetical protein HE1_00894 [Holospora elegans E1]
MYWPTFLNLFLHKDALLYGWYLSSAPHTLDRQSVFLKDFSQCHYLSICKIFCAYFSNPLNPGKDLDKKPPVFKINKTAFNDYPFLFPLLFFLVEAPAFSKISLICRVFCVIASSLLKNKIFNLSLLSYFIL